MGVCPGHGEEMQIAVFIPTPVGAAEHKCPLPCFVRGGGGKGSCGGDGSTGGQFLPLAGGWIENPKVTQREFGSDGPAWFVGMQAAEDAEVSPPVGKRDMARP